ncbi:MAG: metallophosphoesterase family protein [Thermaerobacter sp.]|nr:metallophosphoesterase family protein [Thermaerobacter sp.]
MRIAALYDIHGNLPAMEAALHSCREEGPSAVVIGGDLAAGPLPAQTLDILMALGQWAVPIKGDADRALVAAYDLRMAGRMAELAAFDPIVAWASGRITRSHRDFLANLPDHVVLSADELGEIYFCHGTPGAEHAVVTPSTPEEDIQAMFSSVSQRICVVGRAHLAFDRKAGGQRIVDPGSVGLPCEDAPGAYWAIFGPEVGLRRTEFNLARAARRIERSGMPGARTFAKERVLAAPGRETAGDPA